MTKSLANIKVIGIGGAGGNSVNEMVGMGNVEFISANTDMQDLIKSKANIKIQIGERITKGLGAGANPEIGKLSAEEDKDKIKAALENVDLLFITAGLGGGTGTGAAPIISKIAKDMGILTVGVVTKPFTFEGPKRLKNANMGLKEISQVVDTLVVIPNDKLFDLPNRSITLINAFEEANNILKIGIKGIADLIINQGLINLDFADIRTIICNSGLAMMGFGEAEGEDRAKRATENALTSPLLDRSITGAGRILLNVTGGPNLGLNEINTIATTVTEAAGNATVEVIFGTVMDESLEDGIRVTVIATDFEDEVQERTEDKKEDKLDYPSNYNDILDIPAFIRRNKKR